MDLNPLQDLYLALSMSASCFKCDLNPLTQSGRTPNLFLQIEPKMGEVIEITFFS